MRILKSRYFLYFFSFICLLLAFFGIRKIIENKNSQVAENELIAKGGHHGGHHGHHGGHHGHHGRHDHGHRNFHHDHGNNWWHHNNHPGWNHNAGHHPLHNWYWYGASGLGGAAVGSAITSGWGNNPGYTYDPSYYYQTSGTPSVEYEYDQAPPSTTNINVAPSSSGQPVRSSPSSGQLTSVNDQPKTGSNLTEDQAEKKSDDSDDMDDDDEDDNDDSDDNNEDEDDNDDEDDDNEDEDDKTKSNKDDVKKSDKQTSLA